MTTLFTVSKCTPSTSGDQFLTVFKTPDITRKGIGKSTFVKRGITRYYRSDTEFVVGAEQEIALEDFDEVERPYTSPDNVEMILTYLEPLEEIA